MGVSCGLWVWWLGSGVWLLVFGLLASVVCVGDVCCGLVVVFVVLFLPCGLGFLCLCVLFSLSFGCCG